MLRRVFTTFFSLKLRMRRKANNTSLQACLSATTAAVVLLFCAVGGSAVATFHSLDWMQNGMLNSPYQMAPVILQDGTSTIFIAEGDQYSSTCLRRLDNVSTGPLKIVDDSTCRSVTRVRLFGMIAVPSYFSTRKEGAPTYGVFLQGSSGGGALNKMYFLQLRRAGATAQPLQITGEGTPWLKDPLMVSQPFCWSTRIRFFSPQWASYCVLLISTDEGAVDSVTGQVGYNGSDKGCGKMWQQG